MDSHRERLNQLARQYLDRGDALGWFEQLYQLADGDPSIIPWADLKPNPSFAVWAARNHLAGEGRQALVVGCGLGDDAEFLAGLGFDVTAFDISPTATDWARHRFPVSPVSYQAVDLFNAPAEWNRRFDFVLEAYTIQVLPPQLQQPAIDRLSELVAPGGILLVICRGRGDDEPHDGPIPWPLSRAELARFSQNGLEEVTFEDYLDDEDPPVRRFRAEYRA